MNSHASLNRFYRIVWNSCKCVWQAVAENAGGHSRPGGSAAVRAVAFITLAAASAAHAAPLPTGGNVVAGNGSISQSGTSMTVTQTSSKLAVNWDSFSVDKGYSVNFVQPSASAIALNRVVGSDVSVIQGRISANGQVFLINPNGILFTSSAQVDVGGIVASTHNLRNEDFLAGTYRFEGSGGNAVINRGNISAASGGTVALIGAKVVNEGSLSANGGNVLLGAGSKVVLDLGGPVKLMVEKGAVDALIENGGAIRADGGHILLSAKAAGNLASTVINNTGLVQAQTLASGEKGEIYLLGGMENDRIQVGGTLDASAPHGGDGGFIETSAAKVSTTSDLRVTTLAPGGQTGTWLIDPLVYTVAASGGDETGAALAGRLSSTNIQLQADNTININDAVSWNANRLTLTSGGNINVNATLEATGTGSLAFEYGQATTNGAGTTYTVADNAHIYLPSATAFTWKKGNAGTVRNLVFDNGNLRFGNGTQASINSNGLLEQPWYFDNTSVVGGVQRNAWYKLTYSSYPLNLEVGAGGDGSSSWNRNGSLLDSQSTLAGAISGRRLDIAKYKEGTGTVVSSVNLAFASGESVKVENTYTLDASASFVKTDTTLTNLGAGAASNLRLWVGTQDDYVATRDSQYKFKGNLTANGFEQITDRAEQAKALKVSEFNDGTGAAILFYSTSGGADTSIAQCCSFTNATGINPRASEIWRGPEDGSYALFIRLPDLANGQSSGMTWYYAAAPAAQLSSVVTSVASSAGVTPSAPAPAAAPATTPSIQETTAVQTAQTLPPPVNTTISVAPANAPAPMAPPPVIVQSVQQGSLPVTNVTGSLAFVSVPLPTSGSLPAAAVPGTSAPATGSSPAGSSPTGVTLASGGVEGGDGFAATVTGDAGGSNSVAQVLPVEVGGRDANGFMRVLVVGGGINFGEPASPLNGGDRAPASPLPQGGDDVRNRQAL